MEDFFVSIQKGNHITSGPIGAKHDRAKFFIPPQDLLALYLFLNKDMFR